MLGTVTVAIALVGAPAHVPPGPDQVQPRLASDKSPAQLPSVLEGYSEDAQYAAGIGRGCVILEAADLRFAMRSADIGQPFMKYREIVRSSIESVKTASDGDSQERPGSKGDALDALRAKHIVRVRTEVASAQAELMVAIGADTQALQRMIRHALWRQAQDGSDGIGFDTGMLLEDETEPTSTALRARIAMMPESALRLSDALCAHDLRVGPAREAAIRLHQALYSPTGGGKQARSTQLSQAIDVVRSSNDALLDEVSSIARGCGAESELLQWRARAFKARDADLLPRVDLLDAFDAAVCEADALDGEAMRQERRRSMEQRDAAMRSLTTAASACARTLQSEGPSGAHSSTALKKFADCAREWEECERRIGAALKQQLRDQQCAAALAIDAYIAKQDSIAWSHWRDRLQFWTSFIEDQTTPRPTSPQ